MAKAIRYHKTGSSSVLVLDTIAAPTLGANDVFLRQTAVGFNFIDVLYRKGAISVPELPSPIGFEAVGVVESTGANVTDLKRGDRVVYAAAGLGAYASERAVPAAKVVKVPDNVSDEQAAAVIFKGLTAWYLCHRTFPVKPGSIVLIHAAAGGVGLLLSAWCKALGARVFGTVGSASKIESALKAGCEKVFVLGDGDVVARLQATTGGAKAHVVYDSVGRDTFELSFDALTRFGVFVSFGAASGPPPAIEVSMLNAKGCLFATRPSVFPHIERREDLVEGAGQVLAAVAKGTLPVVIGGRYALADAARLHADVEARKTTGSQILVP